MIEAYAFIAAFTLQILVVSLLHPVWFTKYARAKAEAQLPDWNFKYRDRFLSLYRAANTAVAVLGMVLLSWLLNHTPSPNWDVALVRHVFARYTVVQILPYVLVSLMGVLIKRKALTSSMPNAKRTASLQRRGLFDIVSPFTVLLAVLAYFLFAAFAIYIQRYPISGFSGYRILCTVTLVYALNAFLLFWLLYGRKRWPLETRAYRMQAVELQLKITLYASIALVVFLSLNFTLELLELQRWALFAGSVYIVVIVLVSSMVLFALRRQAEADRLSFNPAS